MLFSYLVQFALLLTQFEVSYAACGGLLEAHDHTHYVTSPSYPNNYPSNQRCIWKIASTTSKVHLTLQGYYFYGADSLDIYIGRSSYTKRGSSSRYEYYTVHSNFTFVTFFSDSKYQRRGFNITYQNTNPISVAYCHGTPRQLVAQNDSKILQGPKGVFSPFVICEWIITAERGYIEINVEKYNIGATTRCSSGSLEMYNSRDDPFSVASLCGVSNNANLSFWSELNEIYIKLRFHNTIEYPTFSLQYKTVEKSKENPACLGGETVLQASESDQILFSPGYPNDYKNFLNCVWRIESTLDLVQVTVEDYAFDLFSFDTLVISDMLHHSLNPIATLEGSSRMKREFWSHSNVTYIQFYTDGNGTERGFKLKYKAVDKTAREPISAADCLKTPQELIARNESSILQAPDYNEVISINAICEWKISAESGYIEINVEKYDIGETTRCFAGSLQIYSSRDDPFPIASLCGVSKSANLSFWSELNEIYIKLHFDMTIPYPTFLLGYKIVEKPQKNPACLGGETVLQASESDQILYSPGYPNDYKNFISCVWRIESILDLVQVTVEEYGFDFFSNDTLVITDIFNATSSPLATLRGSSKISRVFWSSSNVTYIQFHTDGSGTDKGFKLIYTAVDKSAKDILGEPSKLAVYLLTSLCTIEFLAIITMSVIGFFYWKSRSQKQDIRESDRLMDELQGKVTPGKVGGGQQNIYETACSDDYVNARKPQTQTSGTRK